MTELAVTATEFKAKCLDLFRRLGDGRLDRVTVTRRGKPMATILPMGMASVDAGSLHGCMAGTVTIPDGFDLCAPIIDEPAVDDLWVAE